jgi:hypothetical protein
MQVGRIEGQVPSEQTNPIARLRIGDCGRTSLGRLPCGLLPPACGERNVRNKAKRRSFRFQAASGRSDGSEQTNPIGGPPGGDRGPAVQTKPIGPGPGLRRERLAASLRTRRRAKRSQFPPGCPEMGAGRWDPERSCETKARGSGPGSGADWRLYERTQSAGERPLFQHSLIPPFQFNAYRAKQAQCPAGTGWFEVRGMGHRGRCKNEANWAGGRNPTVPVFHPSPPPIRRRSCETNPIRGWDMGRMPMPRAGQWSRHRL